MIIHNPYIKNLKDIIRPYYYDLKDLIYRSNDHFLEKNKSLRNKYVGKRVFLLLSGESINQIDITRLKSEYTFGHGFLFLHKDIVDLPLTFFHILESGAYKDKPFPHGWQNHPEHLIHSGYINMGYLFFREVVKNFLKKGSIVFLNCDRIKYFKKINLFNIDHENVFYVKKMGGLHTDLLPRLDLTKRFVGGSAGIIDSILILIYMGFKEIYLCGAGYTYKPRYEMHFYDNYVFPTHVGREKAILEAKRAAISHNKRNSNLKLHGLLEKNNVFRGIYTREFNKKDPDTLNHIKINEYANSVGVKIYNIIPEGFESPIYEKAAWKEVQALIKK